jgi:cob(I)alamin adenosyltransferase
MTVYTKKGDDGTTSLVGGSRVKKSCARLEAYGSVDELNAHLGLLRSLEMPESARGELIEVQKQLFIVGANLATESTADASTRTPCPPAFTTFLEQAIDRMEARLTRPRFFVIPGGHPTTGACHVARTACRRAERNAVALGETEGVDAEVTRYLNRLSDYLFVLSRDLARSLRVEETLWKPERP